ncbi:MAG: type II toxin-antitoxin system VapC family toxin [Gemmatimonadota bacterium]
MPPKYVLDTNCYIDGDKGTTFKAAFDTFSYAATPFLYLHATVVAELQMSARGAARKRLENGIIEPFRKRGRVITPSAASWAMMATTLSWLHEHEGLVIKQVKRSFIFDILIAHSCREAGAILISRNKADLERIEQVFRFEYASPFPALT